MIDFLKLPSPCYVLDEELLDRNLAVIDRVRRESGAEIIVALKACAMWRIFPELAAHADGATASSAAEARLVLEEFGSPAHTYAPTYTDRNIDEILRCSSHITFNSLTQFARFGQRALINGLSCGLRINPEYSPVETDLYNPCVAGSRLGVTAEQLAARLPLDAAPQQAPEAARIMALNAANFTRTAGLALEAADPDAAWALTGLTARLLDWLWPVLEEE